MARFCYWRCLHTSKQTKRRIQRSYYFEQPGSREPKVSRFQNGLQQLLAAAATSDWMNARSVPSLLEKHVFNVTNVRSIWNEYEWIICRARMCAAYLELTTKHHSIPKGRATWLTRPLPQSNIFVLTSPVKVSSRKKKASSFQVFLRFLKY